MTRAFDNKIRKFIQQSNLIKRGDKLLIAVSGGMDSMALLHYFYKYQTALDIEVNVVHVNHMLRGEQSDGDCALVQSFCQDRGIVFFSQAIPIPEIVKQESGNLQAICRRERYRYFEKIMTDYTLHKLVTAHHADDQLESMLMAMIKGTIMNGLQGIRSRRFLGQVGEVIRPFLTVTKEDIASYIRVENIPYREDSSNQKDDYLRNRIRHHVLPPLKRESESVSIHAVHLAQHVQEDEQYLMEQAKKHYMEIVSIQDEDIYEVKIDMFQKVPRALQKRIILILLSSVYKKTNTTQSYALWTAMLTLCETIEGNAELHLPEGFKAVRAYNRLTISKCWEMESRLDQTIIPIGQWWSLSEHISLYIGKYNEAFNYELKRGAQVYYFSDEQCHLPLYVRFRQQGDRIVLSGMSHAKRLSRLFIDEKIPLDQRDTCPLLVTATDEVIAVMGVRASRYLSKQKRPEDNFMLIIFEGKELQ